MRSIFAILALQRLTVIRALKWYKLNYKTLTMKKLFLSALLVSLLITGCTCPQNKSHNTATIKGPVALPALPFSPRHYVCYRTQTDMIIDGDITSEEWSNAPWSQPFTDIEGDLKPAPLYETKMKMLWDDYCLYIAAELTEPHIQAKLRQRDTVIYHDNDFEVFIDPDGDTHSYYEFEMNALNTVWDLLLTTPYRDYGHVIDSWDITGLRSAVKIYGTINNTSDTDDKWTIELAFPFTVLSECGKMPASGHQWKINFSRVEWKTKIENNSYVRETDPSTGKSYPEYNWIWSAQGLINMHYPELWGYLQFDDKMSGDPESDFVYDTDEDVKWELRKLYYAQRNYSAEKRRYTTETDLLKDYGYIPSATNPEIILTMEGFEASLPSTHGSGYVVINTAGRVWLTGTSDK